MRPGSFRGKKGGGGLLAARDMYPHLFVLAQRDGGTRQRKALHPYRLLPQTLPLAVPKNFGGMRLEIFDRGAVPRSLFRPLGALRRLRP